MNLNLLTPRFGTARPLARCLALAFMALAVPAVAHANLVLNGSFEQGGTGSPPWTSVPDWIGGGDWGFGPGSIWSLTPPHGTNVAVFGGSDSYTASVQVAPSSSFNLTAGQDYTFSFESAGQAAYAAGFAQLPWEPGKMGINYFFFYDYPVGDPRRITMVDAKVYPTGVNVWTTSTHTVTASISGPATIHAYLFNNGWAGNVASVYVGVDNFSVVAVPEPGALALAGVGLAVTYAFRRRRIATSQTVL